MSGVVFIVSIPSEEYEKELRAKVKKKVTIQEPESKNSPVFPLSATFFEGNRFFSSDDDLQPLCSFNENVEELAKSNVKFNECVPMQEVLKNILISLDITNSTWCKGCSDNKYLQITFSLENLNKCEKILASLKENNIGKWFHSTVSLIPCTIHYCEEKDGDSKLPSEFEYEETEKHTAWNRFVSSVRSRITVAEVVENLKTHATFTFDFICMLLIATTLCAIGLAENSNVYLLSSMLISPMMGPVMAGTFGTVIQDKRLQKIGVQNELVGLGIATLVGFCYGSVNCFMITKYSEQDWPTYEMISRGEYRTLWIGCLIALLSGAAVALGILSDNIASLVGVAISTSLMPPAVNAGLLWSIATIHYIEGNDTVRYTAASYTKYYSNDRGQELLILGAVSLCLTFINIVCIYVAGLLVFKIKEVGPLPSRDHQRRQFWTHDIKIARNYNKTIHSGTESSNLYKTIHKDIVDFCKNNKLQTTRTRSTDNCNHLQEKHLVHNFRKRVEYTWSPCMNSMQTPHVKDCIKLFSNLINDKSPLNLPRPEHHRRLSQIFSPNPCHIDDKLQINKEVFAEIHPNNLSPNVHFNNNATGQNNPASIRKKFIVTPCTCDPLE